MSNIVFKPWIGKNYQTGIYGLKILVLGESHYGKPNEENDDFTIQVVKNLGITDRHSFFTITAKFILGMSAHDWISDDQRTKFWHDVAFYNYVQGFVSDQARVRPSQEMWDKSGKAFLEVLNQLTPNLIIVLGKELYSNMKMDISNKFTLCPVKHPSSGFSYEKWRPILIKAIEEAQVKNAHLK